MNLLQKTRLKIQLQMEDYLSNKMMVIITLKL